MFKEYELKNQTILVTGSSSQTAKYFFKLLKKNNFKGEIRCLIRETTDKKKINSKGLNCKFIISDLSNTNILYENMIGAKIVLHIAHISYSENIIKSGIKAGVDWFICVHTTGRYSKFKSASKTYIEIEDNLIKKYNNLTILRPTMIYGDKNDRNMWRLIEYIYNNKIFPVFGNGNNILQPIHSRDLGFAYYDVIVNRKNTYNKQYNLSGKNEIKYIDLLRLIAWNLNKKIFFIRVKIWISLILVFLLNKIPKLIYKSPIKVEQVLRMMENKNFSHDKATIDFNFNPVSIEKGIKEEIENFLKSNK